MEAITPTTELEAVNQMLIYIGQAPVSTLTATGIKDVNVAKATLRRITRQVQSRGWNWNQDNAYTLSPDINGIILVPAGVLKIDEEDTLFDFVVRRHESGLALYNRIDQTFVFTEPVKVKVTWGFTFEDLPETARSYIATAAARRFQANVVGSQILDRYEEEDVMAAWMLLEREERASRDTNLFRKNKVMGAYINRRY